MRVAGCGVQKTRKKKAVMAPMAAPPQSPVARQLFSPTLEPASRPSSPEAQHAVASMPDVVDGNAVAEVQGGQDERLECLQDEHLECRCEVEDGHGGTAIAPTCADASVEMDACGQQGEMEQDEQDPGASTLQSATFEGDFDWTECASSPQAALDALQAAQELRTKVVSMRCRRERLGHTVSRQVFKQDLLDASKTLEKLLLWRQHPRAKFKLSLLFSASLLIPMLQNGATVCAVLP